MIGYLSGTVFDNKKNPVIVMVSGVGYLVHIPQTLWSSLSADQPIRMFVHTHVRDDALDLYGFATGEELSLFELLLSVSGIGPKTALTVVGRGAQKLRKAITGADVDFFTQIPRLGKKNAQKIIIELKSKLGSLEDLDLRDDGSSETKDLSDALSGMGFDRKEIYNTIKSVDGSLTFDQKLLQALKLLGRQK